MTVTLTSMKSVLLVIRLNIYSVKNDLKEVLGQSPICYGVPPLCSVMGKRKDIIGVMSNLLRLLQINHDLCHKGTNISESCNISCKFIAETRVIITKKRLRFLVTS